MLNTYERQLIFSYLSNAASRFHHTSQQEALAEWVAENSDILALNDENEALSKQRELRSRERKLSVREWKSLREIIEKEYAAARKRARKDRIAQRLQRLGREMDLAPADLAFLELGFRCETHPVFADHSAVRRDGGCALRPKLAALFFSPLFPSPVRRLQGVPKPAARYRRCGPQTPPTTPATPSCAA